MKKIIESDLISIAHRILKLKDKSDIQTLLKETRLLHDKLVLLQFYEDNKFRLDPSITEDKLFYVPKDVAVDLEDVGNKTDYMSADIVNDLLEDTKNNEVITFEEDIITPIEMNASVKEEDEQSEMLNSAISTDKKTTSLTEEDSKKQDLLNLGNELNEKEQEKKVVEFTPSIEETKKTIEEIDEQIEQIEERDPIEDAKTAVERATLEIDPVFSIAHNQMFKQEEPIQMKDPQEIETANQHFVTNQQEEQPSETYRQAPINKTINDAFAHKISIGLNDRIAFEKNLFNGSGDDLNRVISQLNTIESFQEAQDFIDDLVKPEFNNWQGKDDYESRFMALVEKRFL